MGPGLAALHRSLGAPAVRDGNAAIWQGDAIELLARVPDASIQLVLTSPPYNIGKSFEPQRTVAEYVQWSARWLAEVARILTPTGAAWINLGYMVVPGRGTVVPIPYLLWPHLTELHLIQEVVWHQSNGVACRRRLSPRNEKLLWLVRDSRAYMFNLDAIRDSDVAYAAQRRGGKLRCNPLGKNPSDVWVIPRVTAGRRSSERTDHPTQMPLTLAERVILTSSRQGEVVLDPFAGSGTTLAAARQLMRVGTGFELRADYIEIARDRLRQDH